MFKQMVFPLIYSDKTLNVLSDLNFGDSACEIKNIQNLDINSNLIPHYLDANSE